MRGFRRLRARLRLWRPRWRRANLAALRLFLRVLPSERQRVFALTILIGVLCGIAAVAFHLAIRATEQQFIGRAMSAPGHSWVWRTILTPMVTHALEHLRVSEAMPAEPVALPADLAVAQALKRVSDYDYSTYPVVEDGGGFTGMVSESRLRRTVAEGKGELTVRQAADPGDYLFPDQPLLRAVVRMNRSKARPLAVVVRGEGRTLTAS
jgi:predicted transcriptional regulator